MIANRLRAIAGRNTSRGCTMHSLSVPTQMSAKRVRDKLCVQENHRSGFSLTVKPARMGNMTLPVAQRRDRRIQTRKRARGAKEAAGYNFVKARLLLRAVVLPVNFIFHQF